MEVSPNAGFALNTLGAALLRAGQPSEALTVLAKAAEINQNFPVDDSLMALAHAALGQSAQASAALQRAETISLSAWNVGISRAILEEARLAVKQDREQKANDAP